ncbi:unnamed protein product [Lymnaea stagnalis]|uniref:Uncharacterized protein n=1 Tax=Lymnaea stagnalis TaxID=6523 RepID=A0AAV2H9J8_LYMST
MTRQRRRLAPSPGRMNSYCCRASREAQGDRRQTPQGARLLGRTDRTTESCRGAAQHTSVRTMLFTGLSLSLWIYPVLVDGQVNTTRSHDENITINANKELPADITCFDCDVSGRIAGAVIGSLIGGLILGAALTYLYFNKRGLTYRGEPMPPKDYDVSDVHFDVNRNDEVAYDNGAEVSVDTKGVKGHKKLERLAKATPTAPVDIEIPSVATPLILSYDSPGEDNPAVVITPSSNKSLVESNPLGDMYSNQGQGIALNQPYEALDIIPEEVEYENSRCNDYEQVLMEVPESA